MPEPIECAACTPWRDGTTHLVMSPPEFMQRLAALVPRPWLRLIRLHGVLAPNARLRPLVVPKKPEAEEQVTEAATASAVFDAMRDSREPMDLSSWRGANRSDTGWYREDLQRRQGGKDAVLCAA